MGRAAEKRCALGVTVHVVSSCTKACRRHEIPRREPRAVIERKGGGSILLSRSEPLLDSSPFLPAPSSRQLPSQNLSSISANQSGSVSDREDDVGQRAPQVFGQRGSRGARRDRRSSRRARRTPSIETPFFSSDR